MANVTIRNLNQKYDGGFPAVKDVNLESCDKDSFYWSGPPAGAQPRRACRRTRASAAWDRESLC